jgi:hypothetical protein
LALFPQGKKPNDDTRSMGRNLISEQMRPVDVHIVHARSQIVRLAPVVAAVHGGGTSAVVMRGDDTAPRGGVRVTRDEPSTASSGVSR